MDCNRLQANFGGRGQVRRVQIKCDKQNLNVGVCVCLVAVCYTQGV